MYDYHFNHQEKPKISFFSDYYNYYYGGYSQNPEATYTHDGGNEEAAVVAADGIEATEGTTTSETPVAEISGQLENSVAASTEVCAELYV